MPLPLRAAEMKAKSGSQSHSVDRKGHSRPGSTSSFGTVNIMVQPPVSDLDVITGGGTDVGSDLVAAGVEQLCDYGVRYAVVSVEPSRCGPAGATAASRGGERHDSDGLARRGAPTRVRASDADGGDELHGGRGTATSVDGGVVPQSASFAGWDGSCYPAAVGEVRGRGDGFVERCGYTVDAARTIPCSVERGIFCDGSAVAVERVYGFWRWAASWSESLLVYL